MNSVIRLISFPKFGLKKIFISIALHYILAVIVGCAVILFLVSSQFNLGLDGNHCE